MSNISKNSGTNVGIELSSIAVTGESGGRGECWKFNISNQFPIIPSNIENGEVVLDVDSPHKGYSIQTVMENGKMNGESRILNKKKIKVASLVFVDGIANGPCKLYDEEGSIVFEGYLKNGYREGKGKEYDENGNVIFEGFYEQGKRMNIVEMKEMKGYWKEMNERNEMISICKKDEEGNNDGICYFYVNGDIDRISEWKNGEEISDSGYCKIFDEPNKVFFEGYFENGKREGKGKEYDLNDRVVYDGLYRNGKRINIVVVKEMKGYWKEMNEDNEVISICKKNDKFENDGICYFYLNGNIDRISEWKNGEEMNVLKRFEGNKMIEFVKGVKRYEGEYRDSIKHNYPREGKGEEYDTDGEGVIYQGQFENGKRQGMGKLYRNGDVVYNGKWIMGYRLHIAVLSFIIALIVMIAMIVILFFLSITMGIVLLAIDVVFFIVLGICYGSVLSHMKENSKDKKAQNSAITDRKYSHFIYWTLGGIAFSIVFTLISIIILLTILVSEQIAQNNLLKQCLGSFSQTSLDIKSDICSGLKSLNLNEYRYLKSIEIGNECFENVELFNINGLNELKSLKIGINSFTSKIGDNNPSRSFHILNCIELESIEIGESSFSDYGGGFELVNLPKLETIKIGEIGSRSLNFYYSSFEIKGIIDMILLMNRSSTFEFH